MISFLAATNLQNKVEVLEQFVHSSATVVVSDLETKLFFKRHFFKKTDFIAEDQLLRISELWRIIFQRLYPDTHVSSPALTMVLLQDFIDEHGLQISQAKASPRSLYQFINQVSPILAHPQGLSLLREWWQEQPLTRIRSEEWFSAGEKVWEFFLNQNIFSHEWLPALLSFESGVDSVWSHPLVFDLGGELLGPEIELIRNLAKTFEVTVILPEAQCLTGRVLKLYQSLGYSDPVKTQLVNYEGISTCRYTSQTAEVKAATKQIRDWLEQGVAPDSIALIAPRLDDYAIVLREHLSCEGIPFNFKGSQPILALPPIQRWCARLRILLGEIKSEDLLIGFNKDFQALSLERFQRIFSQIYDVADLKRDKHLIQIIGQGRLPARVSRNEFIFWGMSHAPEALSEELLMRILLGFTQASPARVKLPPMLWLKLFCEMLARTENANHGELVTNCICVSQLRSTDGLRCSHKIVLGLSEEQLGGSLGTPLMSGEVDRLASDLGFYLIYPQTQQLQFAAKSLLSLSENASDYSKSQKTILCFSESSVDGQVLTPSEFWLRACVHAGGEALKVQSYSPSRFDQLQRLGLEGFSEHTKLALQRELQIQPLKVWPKVPDFNLSASRVKSYLECPFTVAANTHFRLTDWRALDLDLDPAVQGQLLHKAVELAWGKAHLSVHEAGDFLDRARADLTIDLGDDDFWLEQRARLARWLVRFFEIEMNWLKIHSHWQQTLHEVDIKGFVNADGSLSTLNSSGSRPFRGRIDRVDVDSKGQLSLMDYKLSTLRYRNWSKWLSGGDVQLPLYMAAVEGGLTPVTGEVVGAFYFDLKNSERVRGMVVDEYTASFGEVTRTMLASQEQKQELMRELKSTLKNVLSHMESGEFAPQPREEKLCGECHWSKLCRAPHLSY